VQKLKQKVDSTSNPIPQRKEQNMKIQDHMVITSAQVEPLCFLNTPSNKFSVDLMEILKKRGYMAK
jgi:hypothetical protein